MAESIEQVEGRGCVVRGDDIDTDRIIPARYLRCVTFEDVGEHAFEDDREQAKGDHPLDQESAEGTTILVVGRNFGCGSSREHAPQALMRRGFRAFVGGSFAEIFLGNCTALGLPCATLESGDLTRLMDAVEADPDQILILNLSEQSLQCRAGRFEVSMKPGARDQFLEGNWHATRVLLEAGDAIEACASRLSYV